MLKKSGLSKTQFVILVLNSMAFGSITNHLFSASESLVRQVFLYVASLILFTSVNTSIILCTMLVKRVSSLEQEIKEIKNEKAEKIQEAP